MASYPLVGQSVGLLIDRSVSLSAGESSFHWQSLEQTDFVQIEKWEKCQKTLIKRKTPAVDPSSDDPY